MINRAATIRWKGYDPDELTKGSHKRVWVNCIDCGRGRWVQFWCAPDRCKSCAQILTDPSSRALKYYADHPEAKEAARLKPIEQYSVPGALDEKSINRKRYIKNHPEELKAMSERMLKYYRDNPGAGAEQSKIMAQYYRDHPEARDEMSIIKKEHYKKHPEHLERISSRMQGIQYADWEGFVGNDNWRDWDDAIYMNASFTGCHRHYITATIVVHIPAELHNHIRHNLKTGKNMGEMNALAIQFINRGL